MDFHSEPDWIKQARKAPLRSTWESRQVPLVDRRVVQQAIYHVDRRENHEEETTH